MNGDIAQRQQKAQDKKEQPRLAYVLEYIADSLCAIGPGKGRKEQGVDSIACCEEPLKNHLESLLEGAVEYLPQPDLPVYCP